jgi:hypothetical protein
VRIAIVSHHVPDVRGSAAGRILAAVVEGLLERGCDIRLWAWQPHEPRGDLPAWCRWQPVPPAGPLRVRARSLVAPRTDIARARWPFPDDGWEAGAVAVAEDVESYAAVRWFPARALSLTNLAGLDDPAIGVRSPRSVQDRRAERRAGRDAPLVLALSERVAAAIGGRAVPAGYPIPGAPRPPVEEPLGVVAADWRWPPNRWALDRLLTAWPHVRAAVRGARLLLAGTGLDDVGTIAGVEAVGRVGDTAELLSRAAVVPFPYPATSGPKIKIMEALASGVPVVTTPAGVEGLALPAGAGGVLAPGADDPARFAAAVVTVLGDPSLGAALGASGRAAMLAGHTPAIAADARADALATRFALS